MVHSCFLAAESHSKERGEGEGGTLRDRSCHRSSQHACSNSQLVTFPCMLWCAVKAFVLVVCHALTLLAADHLAWCC